MNKQIKDFFEDNELIQIMIGFIIFGLIIWFITANTDLYRSSTFDDLEQEQQYHPLD